MGRGRGQNHHPPDYPGLEMVKAKEAPVLLNKDVDFYFFKLHFKNDLYYKISCVLLRLVFF